jgi:hypothetical protein
MSTPILQQRLGAPGQSSLPKHVLGDVVQSDNGNLLRYVEFAEAVVAGDAVCGTLLQSTSQFHANNIADEQSLTLTASTPFTVEVRNPKTGLITTAAVPRTASIVHIADGTGDQQFAIVDGVSSTSKILISDIQNGGGGWASALDLATTGDNDINYISLGLARKADSDLATHGVLPVLGFVQRAYASGDYGWIVADGTCMAKVLSTPAIGSPLVKSATAGSVRMARMYGSDTVDLANIADQASLLEEVTVTGAIVGDLCQTAHSIMAANEVAVTASVSAAATVQVIFTNNSGGAVNLGSGDVNVGVTAMQSFSNPDCGVVLSANEDAGQLALIGANCAYIRGAQMPLVYKDA